MSSPDFKQVLKDYFFSCDYLSAGAVKNILGCFDKHVSKGNNPEAVFAGLVESYGNEEPKEILARATKHTEHANIAPAPKVKSNKFSHLDKLDFIVRY